MHGICPVTHMTHHQTRLAESHMHVKNQSKHVICSCASLLHVDVAVSTSIVNRRYRRLSFYDRNVMAKYCLEVYLRNC